MSDVGFFFACWETVSLGFQGVAIWAGAGCYHLANSRSDRLIIQVTVLISAFAFYVSNIETREIASSFTAMREERQGEAELFHHRTPSPLLQASRAFS